MKKYIPLLVLLTTLTACESLDSALTTRGNISEQESPFDGQRTVAMTPALAKSGMSDIQAEFGLFWQSDFEDDVVVSVEIPSIDSFASNSPLLIKVDGETFELPPFDRFSSGSYDIEHLKGIGVYGSSTKSFMGSKEVVKAIVEGSSASYRIMLSGKEYADGEITYEYRDYQSYVPKAFERFLQRIEQ